VTLIGATAYDICPGPDGNLWVADEVQHGVWQVTTGGSTTFFILSGSEPYGICPGPDGNLWVADYLHTIWSVTPAGVGTPYTTTLARTSSPTGICPGPDGNLYASDSYVAASPYTYVWQVLFPTGGWHLGSIVWK
jgi:streptogramin lyase